MTMMASREVGRDWRDAGGVEFGMSRAFFLSLRSFVRGDAVRVLPLALLLRLGYEMTGAGGSRTFLGLVV